MVIELPAICQSTLSIRGPPDLEIRGAVSLTALIEADDDECNNNVECSSKLQSRK